MGVDAQKVVLDISTSLDGFVAGPNPTLGEPLGRGGERLHEWVFELASFRERHGKSGGVRNADDEVVAESLAATGAVVMGRNMFSGGAGAWQDDPNADGWWGDTPPFQAPVFVVTHHAREQLAMEGGTTFTFVTDGVESAVGQARAAAGDKDVLVAGGASLAQQVLGAGLLDELQIHLTPVVLGDGTRLLDHVSPEVRLEVSRVIGSPSVTHLRLRVLT
ncbi:MAG: dihydrofolate reductase family protein [Actinobacteria bacterium]|nr:dihydrofolate reductase family protein [Actinomycetota bacterium]